MILYKDLSQFMLVLSLFWRWSGGRWLLPALITRISELLRSSVLPHYRCRFIVSKLASLYVNGCVIMYPLAWRCRWPFENPTRKRSWKYWEKPRKIRAWIICNSGMSNMRPFASTPAARTRDTVIWSFNGQNCSFYNLNWINLRRSKKNSMLFFIQNKNKNTLQ